MSLSDRFKELRERGQRPISEAVKEIKHPQPFEVGLRHPRAEPETFVLLKDMGGAEIRSGTAGVSVDGTQGQVSIGGRGIVIFGDSIHLQSGPRQFWIDWQRFDPLGWWSLPPELGLNPTESIWRGPLVLNDQSMLQQLRTLQFVVGPPDTSIGQRTVTLGSLIHPQPLLGPNEQIYHLVQHIKDLLKSLHRLGG